MTKDADIIPLLEARNGAAAMQTLDRFQLQLAAQQDRIDGLQAALSTMQGRFDELERTLLQMRVAQAGHGPTVR